MRTKGIDQETMDQCPGNPIWKPEETKHFIVRVGPSFKATYEHMIHAEVFAGAKIFLMPNQAPDQFIIEPITKAEYEQLLTI